MLNFQELLLHCIQKNISEAEKFKFLVISFLAGNDVK